MNSIEETLRRIASYLDVYTADRQLPAHGANDFGWTYILPNPYTEEDVVRLERAIDKIFEGKYVAFGPDIIFGDYTARFADVRVNATELEGCGAWMIDIMVAHN